MSLIDTKSLLAKLMATEDLHIVQSNVDTASFNVETRVLTVPILNGNLSRDVYDLFMGHEVGHALYTQKCDLEKSIELKLNKGIVNVVEDSRIERKIKNKYPGIKAPFIRAYNDLYDKDFFGTYKKDLSEYNFIDRVNLHCKVGSILNIQFDEFEKELLKKVETTETFEDVLSVSKEIQDYMLKEAEEEQKQTKQKIKIKIVAVSNEEKEGNEEEKQELPDLSGDDVEIEIEFEDNRDKKTKPKQKEEEQDSENTPKDENSSEPSSGFDADINIKPEDLVAETDESFHKKEKQLFDIDRSAVYKYGNIPELPLEDIYGYKELWRDYISSNGHIAKNEFNKYRKESSKVVSYLVKEFELRKNADQLKRASTAKTGDLNMSKLYAHTLIEDIFKKVTVLPGGKSHGLVLFLDWSGSMTSHIGSTMKQLLNLVLFCKKVNIPFEVYSFLDESNRNIKQNIKKGDLVVNSFALANLLSSKMSATEFLCACGGLMSISGLAGYRRTPTFLSFSGTPLNEAVIAAMEIVPKFQKENRLQNVNAVFLTDGEGAGIRGVMDEHGYVDNRYTHLVFRDPKTRREEIYENRQWNHMAQTKKLLNLLRIRTKSNVIGFYICGATQISHLAATYWPEKVKQVDGLDEIKSQFRKERFLVGESEGFDEYYFLRATGMDTDDGEELQFHENATVRGMTTAFTKYAGNKVSSRVVLNRFIKLIV